MHTRTKRQKCASDVNAKPTCICCGKQDKTVRDVHDMPACRQYGPHYLCKACEDDPALEMKDCKHGLGGSTRPAELHDQPEAQQQNGPESPPSELTEGPGECGQRWFAPCPQDRSMKQHHVCGEPKGHDGPHYCKGCGRSMRDRKHQPLYDQPQQQQQNPTEARRIGVKLRAGVMPKTPAAACPKCGDNALVPVVKGGNEYICLKCSEQFSEEFEPKATAALKYATIQDYDGRTHIALWQVYWSSKGLMLKRKGDGHLFIVNELDPTNLMPTDMLDATAHDPENEGKGSAGVL